MKKNKRKASAVENMEEEESCAAKDQIFSTLQTALASVSY